MEVLCRPFSLVAVASRRPQRAVTARWMLQLQIGFNARPRRSIDRGSCGGVHQPLPKLFETTWSDTEEAGTCNRLFTSIYPEPDKLHMQQPDTRKAANVPLVTYHGVHKRVGRTHKTLDLRAQVCGAQYRLNPGIHQPFVGILFRREVQHVISATISA